LLALEEYGVARAALEALFFGVWELNIPEKNPSANVVLLS
jgi:hypothetical protein